MFSTDKNTFIGMDIHSHFLLPIMPNGLWINFLERWFSMTKKGKRRFKKKRNAELKQTLLRKEARKNSKYPICSNYKNTVVIKQSRNRGA